MSSTLGRSTKNVRDRFKGWLWPRLATRTPGKAFVSYSQFGEDAVLYRILEDLPPGFYLDLGAYHPATWSNTYALYCRGWSGITVEANPTQLDLFRAYRPRDVHMCCAVTDNPELASVTYYLFERAVYNTIDEPTASEWAARGVSLVRSEPVPARTVGDILNEHAVGRTVDLLNIDIEGLDEAVLRSWPWDKWVPRFIVSEDHDPDRPFADIDRTGAGAFLRSKGYVLISRCGLSTIWGHHYRLKWLRTLKPLASDPMRTPPEWPS